MKVAIIHDWLTGMRGGELVLDSLLKIYPEAELFTLIYNKGTINERIENRKIHTAFTNNLPLRLPNIVLIFLFFQWQSNH